MNSEPTPLVVIIGAGPVGVALAGKLVRSGVPVAALYGRTVEQAEAAAAEAGVLGLSGRVTSLVRAADVAIIAVADHRVAAVTDEYLRSGVLGSHTVVLHTCGAWAAHELLGNVVGAVKAVGTLHPLASITSRTSAFTRLASAFFGVQGCPVAVDMASRLATLMGGKVLPINTEAMPLYHAGAALGSNVIVAVIDMARQVFESAGVPAAIALPALLPLLRSAADNLEQHGLPQALSGPIARGDVLTVERHLAALDQAMPAVAKIYRQLGHQVLAVAERKAPAFEIAAAARLRAIFGIV